MDCRCDWDPEYHRELNVRRGKSARGAACTNAVDLEGFGGPDFCTACIFGCAS